MFCVKDLLYPEKKNELMSHEILATRMAYIWECFGFFFWSPRPWYLFPPFTDLRELHWYMVDWYVAFILKNLVTAEKLRLSCSSRVSW